MRRDHVKQQWRTLRLPRNIHSVYWAFCLLVALGLYPVLADIILQDMGKCATILFKSQFDQLNNQFNFVS